jgi:hypothetical protein
MNKPWLDKWQIPKRCIDCPYWIKTKCVAEDCNVIRIIRERQREQREKEYGEKRNFIHVQDIREIATSNGIEATGRTFGLLQTCKRATAVNNRIIF